MRKNYYILGIFFTNKMHKTAGRIFHPNFQSRENVDESFVRPAETEVMVSPLCLVCGSTYNCQMSVLRPVRDIA